MEEMLNRVWEDLDGGMDGTLSLLPVIPPAVATTDAIRAEQVILIKEVAL